MKTSTIRTALLVSCLLVTLILGCVGPARAAYDYRLKELKEQIDAMESLDEDTRDKLESAFEGYLKLRNAALADTVATLAVNDRPEAADKWRDKAREGQEDAADFVQQMSKNPAVDREWLAGFARQEALFFTHILASKAPVYRDRMVVQTEALEDAIDEFGDKWREIKNRDGDMDAKLERAAREYEEVVKEALEEATKVEKESKEAFQDWLDKILAAGGVVTKGASEAVLKSLRYGIKILRAQQDKVQERRLEIQVLLSREEQIFGMFKETRTIVEEFLEANDYPAIKDQMDNAEDDLSDLPAKMITDAQKRDAAEFAEDCLDHLEKAFSVAEGKYKEFARANDRLLFGPMGGQYITELLEGDTWKSFSDRWKSQRSDFDDILRDRYFAASEDRILEIPMGELSSKDAHTVYYAHRDVLGELMQAWNWWKTWNKNEDPYWILESREEQERVLGSLR